MANIAFPSFSGFPFISAASFFCKTQRYVGRKATDGKATGSLYISCFFSRYQSCLFIRDARPAPGKNGCPGPPRPRKISTLPRPENIVRMFRGKARGKCSYITKRFCGSKTFEQYFLSDPGVPGVRSMGRVLSKSVRDVLQT